MIDCASSKQLAAAHLLQERVACKCQTSETLTLQELSCRTSSEQLEEYVCIFLLEYEVPWLEKMDEISFQMMKPALLSMRTILWVTGGGCQNSSPGFGVIDGLGRVLRNESGSSKLVTVALDSVDSDLSQHVEHVYRVLIRRLLYPIEGDHDQEYVEKDKMLGISRFVQAEPLQSLLVSQSGEQEPSLRTLTSCPPMKLVVQSPGLLGTLEFIEDKDIPFALEPDELEIKVHGVGISIVDCRAVMGRFKEGWIGSECSGTVVRVGETCQFQKGDAVAFLGFDSFKTVARSRCAVKILPGVSFAEAASIPASVTMACYALEEVAKIQPGESVLITHASCGVGHACVQIARYLHGDVFAAVSSPAEKSTLEKLLGLHSDRIFFNDVLLAKGILRQTEGRGVDVVLNAMDEFDTFIAWDCIAQFGRFIEVGPKPKLDEWRVRLPPAGIVSYSTIDLRTLLNLRPNLVRNLLIKVMDRIATGQLRVPDMLFTYTASQVEAAFRDLFDRNNAGKTVVTFGDDVTVKVRPIAQASSTIC